MGAIHPQLAAHKGLRADILLELKRAQPLTAKDLAHKLGVSPNGIRHHLKELEAESLIAYGRAQPSSGFCKTCSGPPSSGAPISRAAATPASTPSASAQSRAGSLHEFWDRSSGSPAV